MTNQEIFDLMDRFERSNLQSMKLSMQDFSIELSHPAPVAVPAVISGVSGAAAAPAAPAAAEAPAASAPEAPAITAPLVGTYYAASAPDQPPFVAVGDRVSKGQTVCLIEAMKMMSEVPAPCDCVIEEILKANGELVAFGEPLFHYRAV
nr:acetyl-CoA carboxylase biotin carboxyl carrier protein [uncultured Oscillibacter sp.]